MTLQPKLTWLQSQKYTNHETYVLDFFWLTVLFWFHKNCLWNVQMVFNITIKEGYQMLVKMYLYIKDM